MTMTETAKPLKNNTYAVTSSRGVDEWGLYFEFVQLDPTLVNIDYYCRVFVAGSHVSFYERKAQTARTTWKPFVKESPDAARDWAVKLLKRGKGNNVMRGSPLLVQLEPADVETMAQGKSPGARYRATSRHEALFGKLEVHQDAKPQQMDYSGVQKAIEVVRAGVGLTSAADASAAAIHAATTSPIAAGKPTGVPAATPIVIHHSGGATATITVPEANPTKSTPLSTPIDWEPVIEEAMSS